MNDILKYYNLRNIMGDDCGWLDDSFQSFVLYRADWAFGMWAYHRAYSSIQFDER